MYYYYYEYDAHTHTHTHFLIIPLFIILCLRTIFYIYINIYIYCHIFSCVGHCLPPVPKPVDRSLRQHTGGRMGVVRWVPLPLSALAPRSEPSRTKYCNKPCGFCGHHWRRSWSQLLENLHDVPVQLGERRRWRASFVDVYCFSVSTDIWVSDMILQYSRLVGRHPSVLWVYWNAVLFHVTIASTHAQVTPWCW